jgi:hypothetical protein
MMGGYYNEKGKWIQTKHCLLPCYENCDCQPPNGVYQLPLQPVTPVVDKDELAQT